MFKLFIENDLISPNKSGFKPGDSCIKQCLSITHDIYKSLTAVIDKVWHDCVIFILEQNDISGKLQTFTWLLHKQKIEGSIKWAGLLMGQC